MLNYKEAAKVPKERLGLFNKFLVRRQDGSDINELYGKHYGCEYFVLDMTHDKYAVGALRKYADDCEKDLPTLARDLRIKADELEDKLKKGKTS